MEGHTVYVTEQSALDLVVDGCSEERGVEIALAKGTRCWSMKERLPNNDVAITEDGLGRLHIEIGQRVATALEKALLVPLGDVVIVPCRRHRSMKDNTVNVRYRVGARVGARYPQNPDVIGVISSLRLRRRPLAVGLRLRA